MNFILGLILMLQPMSLLAQAKHTQPYAIKTGRVEFPFRDKSLSKEKIKELIVHFWPDRKNIMMILIFKTSCDDDWVIQYAQNIPQYKFTNRKIDYVYKKDNTCYKVENLIFYCDYLGGGQYGDIHIGYADNTKTMINDCIN